MNRLLSILLIVALTLCTICVSADGGVSAINLVVTTDYQTEITTITADVGTQYAGRWVDIIILNPGKSFSSMVFQEANAVNWVSQSTVSQTGEINVDMELTPYENTNETQYTAIVLVDTMASPLSKTFDLYNQNFANGKFQALYDAIEANDAGEIVSIIDTWSALLGISSLPEFSAYGSSVAKADIAQGLIEENPTTADAVRKGFSVAVQACSLKNYKENETDYLTNLEPLLANAKASVKGVIAEMKTTAETKTQLFNILKDKMFYSSKGIIAELNDRIVLDKINSAKLWSEAADIYVKFADVLEIDLTKYNALNDKKTPMTTLAGVQNASIGAAGTLFTTTISNAYDKENPPGGGGGGGGGGSLGGNKNDSLSDDIVTAPVVDTTPKPVTTPAAQFSDLGDYDWAKEDITILASMGILNGYDGKSFKPASRITRAEFAEVFVKAFSIRAENINMTFEDVGADDWFYNSVKALYSAGIINGVTADSFDPNAPISRQDIAVILYRYLGETAKEKGGFSDVSEISDYAKNAALSLAAAGIIKGYEDNSFRPADNTLRAEAAVLIARIMREKGAI